MTLSPGGVAWQCLQERDGSGELVARYTYSPGYIGAVARQERDLNGDQDFADSGERVWYHSNTLHSVYALSDASESVVERYKFDAYGAATVLEPDGASDPDGLSDAGNPYLFTSRRADPESGLMQYRHRYYSPGLGRFVTRDPIGYVAGPNLYQYVADNPLFFVDPWGLDKLVFDGKKVCRVTDDFEECVKCWKARSGHPLKDDDGNILRDEDGDPIFPEPTKELQRRESSGPIPAGLWTFHSCRTRDPREPGIWSREDWNDYDRGLNWLPFGKPRVRDRSAGPWGDWFTRLAPGEDTETYGRCCFNVHGGRFEAGGQWGSAGCIDLMCPDEGFFGDMLEGFDGEDLDFWVDYSGEKMPDDCEEPEFCEEPWVPDAPEPEGGGERGQ